MLCLALLWWTPSAPAEEDPYDTAPRLTRGVFEGELIDNRERRSIVLLPEEKAARYWPGPNERVVANFFHEGQFWIAKIPVDAVERIYFQKDVFSKFPPAAHSQLRFQLREGAAVKLYAQRKGQGRPRNARVRDFVFSVEATMMKGDQYGLIAGLRARFGYAARFLSLEDSYFKMVYGPRHHVEQIPIELGETERQAILSEAILKSDRAGMKEAYNTLCASCTTEVFHLLDRELSYPLLGRLGALLDRLPITPRTYLYARGLIPWRMWLRNPTPSLEEEFSHWESREDFRERWEALQRLREKERGEFLAWERERRGKNRSGASPCPLHRLK